MPTWDDVFKEYPDLFDRGDKVTGEYENWSHEYAPATLSPAPSLPPWAPEYENSFQPTPFGLGESKTYSGDYSYNPSVPHPYEAQSAPEGWSPNFSPRYSDDLRTWRQTEQGWMPQPIRVTSPDLPRELWLPQSSPYVGFLPTASAPSYPDETRYAYLRPDYRPEPPVFGTNAPDVRNSPLQRYLRGEIDMPPPPDRSEYDISTEELLSRLTKKAEEVNNWILDVNPIIGPYRAVFRAGQAFVNPSGGFPEYNPRIADTRPENVRLNAAMAAGMQPLTPLLNAVNEAPILGPALRAIPGANPALYTGLRGLQALAGDEESKQAILEALAEQPWTEGPSLQNVQSAYKAAESLYEKETPAWLRTTLGVGDPVYVAVAGTTIKAANAIKAARESKALSLAREVISKTEPRQVAQWLEDLAVPFRKMEYTPENWRAEFGDRLRVRTPIGEVKLGENQFVKLMSREPGRERYIGLIKPTLEDPLIIAQTTAEKTLFVKTFGEAGTKTRYVSAAIDRDGMKIIISNHPFTPRELRNLIRDGELLYLSPETIQYLLHWR